MAGNIEEHMMGKLNEYLMKNVDVQKTQGMINRFSEEAEKIAAQIAVLEKLAKQLLEQAAEVSQEVVQIKEEFQIKWEQAVGEILAENEVSPPENISSVIIDGEYASRDNFLESFQGISIKLSSVVDGLETYGNEVRDLLTIFTYHSNEYLSFKERMTVAGVVGIAGLTRGVTIGARIASKIAGKQVFKLAVEAVVKMAVKRTIGGGGGTAAGAAVGAGVGSAVPVVGTAAGAVVGGIVGGVGAWFATDYVAIKLEEHISRESFKKEILSGVNAQKAEMIKALEDIFQMNRSSAVPSESQNRNFR